MITQFSSEEDVPAVWYWKFSMPTTDARYITVARVRDIDQWRFTIAIIGWDLIEVALHRPRLAVLLCRVNHISKRTDDIKTGINVKKFTDISSLYHWFLLTFTIRLNKYPILIAPARYIDSFVSLVHLGDSIFRDFIKIKICHPLRPRQHIILAITVIILSIYLNILLLFLFLCKINLWTAIIISISQRENILESIYGIE